MEQGTGGKEHGVARKKQKQRAESMVNFWMPTSDI